MLKSRDAMRPRRPEIKKTETTRKQTQEALETKRKIRRQRRNLADQLVDQRTSISFLVRRKDRKS
jgi:flagellar motility protein MotE (MotC chaperone)